MQKKSNGKKPSASARKGKLNSNNQIEDSVVDNVQDITKDSVQNNSQNDEQDSIKDNVSEQKDTSSKLSQNSRLKKFWVWLKIRLNNIFIIGLSGMAQGLFATLIVGTILCQIASYIPGDIGYFLNAIGTFAKVVMGAGIGIAVANKFKASTLTSVSAAVSGMIGAYAQKIVSQSAFDGSTTLLVGVGEPLGAFVAGYFAVYLGSLVSGKTKVDILVTPLCCVLGGGILGLLVGSPVSYVMSWFGELINLGTTQQPIVMGIVVSALMGIALTLPISSAAIGVSLGLSGLSAGVATVGCCCQMVGFAVMSFKENRWGGLVAQGLGTSMLQMPNIIRHPIIWLPTIIASMVLGPISSAVLGMTSNAVGSGMGTAGLVGPIMAFTTMMEGGVNVGIILLEIVLMYFVLPALICWGITWFMRRRGWIKEGWLTLPN